MKCPSCNSDNVGVTDSRAAGMSIRRRRKCFDCQANFHTLESIVVGGRGSYQVVGVYSVDAIKSAINFVSDAHAKLSRELRRLESPPAREAAE